jgi:hypothetical protein
MNTFDLAAELETADVTVNALHPATFMPTKVSSGAVVSPAPAPRSSQRRAAPDPLR